MIPKIFELFHLKTQKNLPEDIDNGNSMSFIVTKTDPFIKIVITETSDVDVLSFANMLHEINTGTYINSIINLLLEMGKKDPNIALFVKRTLHEWANLHKNDLPMTGSTNDNNEPIVKPTHFYKLSKNE